jgi:hypothetical protein
MADTHSRRRRCHRSRTQGSRVPRRFGAGLRSAWLLRRRLGSRAALWASCSPFCSRDLEAAAAAAAAAPHRPSPHHPKQQQQQQQRQQRKARAQRRGICPAVHVIVQGVGQPVALFRHLPRPGLLHSARSTNGRHTTRQPPSSTNTPSKAPRGFPNSSTLSNGEGTRWVELS